jgi:serine/threonine-protein kinase
MPLSTGQVIHDRYRIVRLLGQGGFGAVYRAWDTVLGRACALKENLALSPEAQRQFEREARLLANLSHPNLPRVIDIFSLPGQGQYLVMDFVEGDDLEQLQQRAGGSLPEAPALLWIEQVCEALEYLHTQTPPVIHRDIKPANIKITPAGKAMLVDFGIAKVYDPQMRTTQGARAVTPGFSPPEQYGKGSTDARSDLYALGATLYALLTGKELPDSVDMLTGNLPPAPAARAANPQVSPQTSAALEKALRLNRAERWESVAAFRAALLQGRSPPPAPMPPAPLIATQVVPLAAAPASSGYASAPQAAPAVVAPQAGVAVAGGQVWQAQGPVKRSTHALHVGVMVVLGLATFLLAWLPGRYLPTPNILFGRSLSPSLALKQAGSVWFGLWGTLAALLAEIAYSFFGGRDLYLSIALLPMLLAEALLPGWAFRHFKVDPRLKSWRDLGACLAILSLSSVLSGVLFTMPIVLFFGESWMPFLLETTIPKLISSLLLTPLLLKLFSGLLLRTPAYVRRWWA